MASTLTKATIAKFQRGTTVRRADMLELLDYYRGVEKALSPCPPEYNLVLRDVIAKRMRLELALD